MKNRKLYVIRISEEYRKIYSKSLHLELDMLEIKELDRDYDEYIKPSLLYFTQDPQEISKVLGVKRVIPMGQYIRGLLGGEKSRGKAYAGLILEEYRYRHNEFEFRLYGTTSTLRVPKGWLQEYGVEVYELVYVGMINPFRLVRLLPVLLSNKGGKCLREFLIASLEANTSSGSKVSLSDVEKIKILINELRQPDSLVIMSKDSYYTVYRCDRAFTSCFVRPSQRTILDSHVSAIECNSEDQAHYYVGVLNYLAYKVVTMGRNFLHHQFARPALAIALAGLSWKDVSIEVRNRVAELSKQLSYKASLRDFPNQRAALNNIVNYAEFKELVKILDEHVEKERLIEALNLVSGISKRRRQ